MASLPGKEPAGSPENFSWDAYRPQLSLSQPTQPENQPTNQSTKEASLINKIPAAPQHSSTPEPMDFDMEVNLISTKLLNAMKFSVK
jgi:hypothetical protein